MHGKTQLADPLRRGMGSSEENVKARRFSSRKDTRQPSIVGTPRLICGVAPMKDVIAGL